MVIKFPNSKDYGGINEFYLKALKQHQNYIDNQIKRIKRMKNTELKIDNNIFIIGDKRNLAAMYNNLANYACNLGKEIIKIYRKEEGLKLTLIGQLG